ncbi:MAG: lamin tail domain-containing protein [Bacteroidia bacterium]|nr:lamin tail domain-containing protein [Bacteroidia bacterium]
MKRMLTLAITLLSLLGSSQVFGQCTNLFFSEYLEGSSNNKALEIYNPTGNAVDLSRYQVRRFNNGGLTPAVFRLSGVLAPDAVYVIGNPSAIAAILGVSDTTGDATFFNGDDAVALIDTLNADTVDIIGIIGNDPGTNWPVGSGATSEFTLVRMASVQEGTTDWTLGATQWIVLPANTTDSLGTHTMTPCGSISTPGTVSFVLAADTVMEAAGQVTLTAQVAPNASTCAVLVSLVPGGTAVVSADFFFMSPDTLFFSATGSMTQTLTVNLLVDPAPEGTESFTLQLDSLSGCAVGGITQTTITILDSAQQTATGSCSSLFFSEYLEGSSNNKALEIYNPSNTGIDLSRYQIQRFNNGGLTPAPFRLAGFLFPGETFVIGNPSAIAAILAVSDTTGDATFFNGDDAVALIDTVLADTVDIIGIIGNDPGTNWPVGTGATSEFTLVRMASVQEGTTDWTLGATQWIVLPANTTDSLGAHTMTPCGTVVVTPPVVNFTVTDIDVAESAGTVSGTLMVSPAAANCAVEVSLLSGGTATAGTDFSFVSPDTVIFTAAGPTVFSFSVPVLNDTDFETHEYFTLKVDSLAGCGIGTNDTLRVTILDDDMPLPVYPIGLITADADANGIADSLNVLCEVRGVVYGVDLRGGAGVQFTIRDQTDGIGVFTTSATVGYTTVTEGDSLHIIGTVSHFNGLNQMINLDTIIVVATGRPLALPVLVTALDETTENELVTLECVKLVNPTQWTGTGSGFTAQITNGTATFDLRIDNDVALYSQPAPVGYFAVTGLGGQFDSSDPRTSGYQLLPRTIADIEVENLPMVAFQGPASVTVDEAIGAPLVVTLSLVNLNPDSTEVWIYPANEAGTATPLVDFVFAGDTVYADGPCGATATASVSVQILDDQLIEGTETVVLYIAAVVNGQIGSLDTVTITIQDNIAESLADLLPADAITLSPNPGVNEIRLESRYRMEQVRIMDLAGRTLSVQTPLNTQTELATGRFSPGVYLVEVTTPEGRWIQKWVKAQP